MAYDPKCYELAEYFMPSDPKLERLRSEMAQAIQDAVEDFLQGERERLSAHVS